LQKKNHQKPSESDAWDATAFHAVKLAKDNERKGSPIDGMWSKGELSWCYGVMIRLLIIVYIDLLTSKDSHFEKLLGGTKVKKVKPKEFKCEVVGIDDRPSNGKNEMDGLVSTHQDHRAYFLY
jgi:hypothetical protein